jgi:lambda family phage portal protein
MAKAAAILDQHGRPFARSGGDGNGAGTGAGTGAARAVVRRRDPRLQARYDAAQTTDDNKRHWLWADALGPVAANSLAIRKTLRYRARYEVANNSYARGLIDTLAQDTIGTGPRLQLLEADSELNARIERMWRKWARAIKLARKLRTLRKARPMDGEGFCVLRNNSAVNHRIKLDPLLVECDRIHTPDLLLTDPAGRLIDGITYDKDHNPVEYHVLREHPGEQRAAGSWGEYDVVRAEYMIHYFKEDRAGQERGIPDLTPALPLFSQLRRYTLAVIAAAETAADFAAVLQTDNPPQSDEDYAAPYDLVELEKRMAMVLPDGYKLGQITPQQPAQTYGEFKHEILNEMARCLGLPSNIASLNSAKHNYASARLDSQTYQRSIGVEREELEVVVLDRIFAAWLRVAAAEGLVPAAMGANPWDVDHEWRWDGFEHVDPVKGARSDDIDLGNNSETLARVCARRGSDWEATLKQAAKEQQLKKDLGLVGEEKQRVDMENVARAVRAGVPVGVAEARAALGLPEELPEGTFLRFNDQDVLQYHIESGVLTINEVRAVLNLPEVPWGNKPVRRNNVSPVSTEEEGDESELDVDESESE